MAKKPTELPLLTRREQQIMSSIYRRGVASVHEVLSDIPDAPSYSSIRTLMRILLDSGVLMSEQDGPRHVYSPVVKREDAAKQALRHVVETYFDGDRAAASNALGKIKR